MALKASGVGPFTIPTAPSPGTATAQSSTANTYGAYVQNIASTAAALFITGVTIGASTTQVPLYVNVNIGTGAAASEVTVAQIQVPVGFTAGATGSHVGHFVPIWPWIAVANATRIACKVASDVASAVSWNISLQCIAASNVVDAGIVEQADVEQFGGVAGTFSAGVPWVNVSQINLQTTSATNLDFWLRSNITRATAGAGGTTTSVTTSALLINNGTAAGVVANQFVGQRIRFTGDTTTAGLRTASALITASSASNTPTFTVSPALPAAPASGDFFIIEAAQSYVVVNADKTGYALTQAFPANFSSLGISAGGHISNVDTLTTYTGDTPQTGDTFALANGAAGFVAINNKTTNLPAAPASTTNITAGTITTTTNLTNAATSGDLTATMKASVTTAATAATPTAAAVTGNVGGNVVGSVGSVVGLTAANLDVAVSTRTKPADTQAAVTLVTTTTNLTNAPTAGDFTAVMKTSLNAATPTVTLSGDFSATMKASLNASTPAAITGAVGSVTGNVGGNVTGSVGSVVGLNPALIDVAISTRFAAVSYTAPDNAGISYIATLTTATLDATISSRTKPADTQAAVGTVNALAASALEDFFTVDSGSSYGASVAGSVVKEIVDNSGTSPVSVAAIVNGVWDEPAADHVTPGTFGANLDIPVSQSQADGPLIR